jgi:hypothetical protein
MNNFFILILSSLAVFRFSELVAVDKGPFSVFKKIRNVFPPESQIDKMLECIYCNGMWWSLLLCAMYAGLGVIEGSLFIPWWLGIAGGAVVIYRSIRPRIS